MEEKDLQGLWNQSEGKASNYYGEIEGEVLKKAKSQSHDILMRVRKNIIWELVLSAVVTVGFPFFLPKGILILWIGIVIMGLAMGLTLKVYLGYLKEIREVNEVDLVRGLEKKVNVLAGYIKQVKILVYIFGPLGFFYGLFLSPEAQVWINGGESNLQALVIQFIVGIPFLAFVFWGFNKYVYWLYGKHLSRLKSILTSLKEEI